MFSGLARFVVAQFGGNGQFPFPHSSFAAPHLCESDFSELFFHVLTIDDVKWNWR